MCTCGSNTRCTFQIEIRQIERDMPLVLVTTCLMNGNRSWPYLLMGDELGSATDIDFLLVPLAPSTPKFTLIGNADFWSCHKDLMPESYH